MLNTALTLQGPLKILKEITVNQAFIDSCPTHTEWQTLSVIRDILAIFLEPTLSLQSATFSTLCTAFIYIFNIRKQLITFETDFKAYANQHKEATVFNPYAHSYT
jgi:hypothetical protein